MATDCVSLQSRNVSAKVHPIKLRGARSYVVRGEGAIVIDAGGPGQAVRFRKALGRPSIDPRSVRLMVMTHGHLDHVGSAKGIQELTGAQIAIHEREAPWLERAVVVLPPAACALGRIIEPFMKLFAPLVRFPPAKVDLLLTDEGMSLAEFGIPGRIVHTPGHSAGSVSVLLENGDAFVGDLAANEIPLHFSPGFPIFADDLGRLRESWRLLLSAGAKTIYPGHGAPFSADVMRRLVG
ncbi:MAG: MBL fold metallo-hydrolase [Planctomycetota bacterium]